MSERVRSQAAGRRVLVVEDDYLVARATAQLLRELGCVVVGPASSAEEACELIRAEPVDVALLDITLTPGTSAPAARRLLYRGIPFIFITGYGSMGMLPDDLRGYRVLHKPVDEETLHAAIVGVLADAPERPTAK